MTQTNPENPTEETPVDTPVEAPVQQAVANPGLDIRRRLRELLSVPERDRSDEVWDEIIELEIQLAPGNRVSGNENSGVPGPGRGPQQGRQASGGGGGGSGGAGGQQKKHRPRANNNRRGRQGKPQAGGGGNPA